MYQLHDFKINNTCDSIIKKGDTSYEVKKGKHTYIII